MRVARFIYSLSSPLDYCHPGSIESASCSRHLVQFVQCSDYAQPICPDLHLWTPGYWAYGPDGYSGFPALGRPAGSPALDSGVLGF